MSAFERYAVQRMIDQAAAVGVPAPSVLTSYLCKAGRSSVGARLWAEAHPDEPERDPCCYGSVDNPLGCECWRPVYDQAQADPRPPESVDDLKARDSMCPDCAYRPDSPERADEWTAEALYATAREGTPFWCHDGMRQPDRWEHPDGRTIAGCPDDWQPPIHGGIPYRADGAPALVCAGWSAVAAKASAS